MTRRIFVGNLCFNVSENELLTLFAPYGATGAVIPSRWSRSRYQADRPKGFGYVDVPETRLRSALQEMQGHVLGGRSLDVSEARPRPELRHYGNGDFPMYGRYQGGRGGGFRRR
jgi:RNA recognition motif-containing protein